MQFVEAHGARIPIVGFGSMRLKEEAGTRAIEAAIRAGYRHIDTAAFYGNEREVGEAIRASGVKREEIFLTTKVRQDNLKADKFARSVDNSLKLLDVPNVDLLLIHWPNAQVPMEESIGALNKAKRDGLAKHIGVANYTVALLDAAMKATKEPLVTNQIEVHPFLDQTKVIAATRGHGMSITAYCPLARGKVPGEPALERIGKAHGKTASQVALRWLVQQGIAIIPGSGKPARQKENFDVLDFALTPAEMTEIAGLKRPNARRQPAAASRMGRVGCMQLTEANGARHSDARPRHLAARRPQRRAHDRAGAAAGLPPHRYRAELWQRERRRRRAARLGHRPRRGLRHHEGAGVRPRAGHPRTRREAEPREPAPLRRRICC